jgi:hypothetical protein
MITPVSRVVEKVRLFIIEQNIERAAGMMRRRRFEPARGHEQRCVPPVIDQRRCRDAHLADDLRPQL